MPVRAEAIGAELPPRIVEVTTRMTLAYAAGVGDVGDRTFDDAAEELVAPPSFCAVLEWPVVSAYRGPVLGLTPDERRRIVHAGQDSTFYRPIRPGDILRTGGRVTGIRATRAGALVQMKLETVEARHSAPVTITWYVAMCRGVAVAGNGGAIANPPDWPQAAVPPERGVSLAVPREAAHVYTECSGIWNPIHSERRTALAAGLPDVILHGSATWALAGRELVRLYAQGDPTRLGRLRARFTAPVIPGRPITLLHRGSPAGDEVHYVVQNADGEVAISEGYAAFHDAPQNSNAA